MSYVHIHSSIPQYIYIIMKKYIYKKHIGGKCHMLDDTTSACTCTSPKLNIY